MEPVTLVIIIVGICGVFIGGYILYSLCYDFTVQECE